MIQILANGFISGLVLGLLALGFQFAYLPTRTFHIAAAGIYTLSAYVALSTLKTTGSWVLAILGALLATVVVSGLCERFNHRSLMKKNASLAVHIISSLGILIILIQIVAMIWGSDVQALRKGLDSVWNIGGIILTRAQILAGVISAVMIIATILFLRLFSTGIRFRALADNPTEFGLMGYNVYRYRLAAFCLSGLLVGVASLLTANDVGFEPYGGLHALLLAVVAVIIGGKGSFIGPVAGGILLGLLRNCVVYWWSARWQDVITFLLLALFLYIRPQGLFAARQRLEAEE